MSAATAMQNPVQGEVFTLLFLPNGEIAVLEMYGTTDKDEARELAGTVLPDCIYVLYDGDISGGNAFCFYSWTKDQAQEQHSGRRPSQVQREEAHV